MSTLSLIVAIVATLNVALAVPMNKPLPPTKPTSDLDLFANQTAPACSTIDGINSIHNGLTDPRYRWNIFSVYPDPAYDENERDAINNAMYNLWDVIPCVLFGIWPPGSNPQGDYVYIRKGNANGCNSYIGRLGGRQDMNLQSPECMSVGTIMHELIHALGFAHEQCRSDRDDHVNIHWENIEGNNSYNFERLYGQDWDTYRVAYNQRSIMHYGQYDFSSNGGPTITAKNGGAVGSEGVLQRSDIQRLMNMYGC